jgi:hypothetical protein
VAIGLELARIFQALDAGSILPGKAEDAQLLAIAEIRAGAIGPADTAGDDMILERNRGENRAGESAGFVLSQPRCAKESNLPNRAVATPKTTMKTVVYRPSREYPRQRRRRVSVSHSTRYSRQV